MCVYMYMMDNMMVIMDNIIMMDMVNMIVIYSIYIYIYIIHGDVYHDG